MKHKGWDIYEPTAGRPLRPVGYWVAVRFTEGKAYPECFGETKKTRCSRFPSAEAAIAAIDAAEANTSPVQYHKAEQLTLL